MKLIHIADLHLGKKLKDFSLIEDQHYILIKMLNILDQEKPDALLIAGDVYDKAIPPLDAVNLLDDFLTEVSKRKIPVFIISGNHDSQDRISFGSRLMQNSGIYFSQKYDDDDKITPIILNDEFGQVYFYLLPFIRPYEKSFNESLKEIIEKMNINQTDKNIRNVLVAHQLVTGSIKSDSEDISIGTLEDVDSSVFSCFDYVALGHIHKEQKCGQEKIRYSGTPLKYSFSEVNDKKGVTVINLLEKGKLDISQIPLCPMRDLVEIKGNFSQITDKAFYSKYNQNDFFKIILTDEFDIPEGFGRLQKIFPNLVFLDYDNERTKALSQINSMESVEKIHPFEIFQEFYKLQNNVQMTDEQKKYANDIISDIWNENFGELK